MTFDATQYELEDTAVLNVQDASGTDDLMVGGKPVTITVYGPGSKQGVKMLHVSGRHAALRTTALIRGKISKNAAVEADEEKVEKLVAITAAINNFPYEGGAEAIYSNPKLCYIADQVEAFFSDKANFSKPSTKNSVSTSDKAPG